MTEITVHTLGHTAAERQATLEALVPRHAVYDVPYDVLFAGSETPWLDYQEAECMQHFDYVNRVTCRMEANDPLALSAALNLAAGQEGIE